MLIEKDEQQHYCYIKRLSALLFDSGGIKHKAFFCTMFLSRFTTPDVLANHQKYFNGVNGRPTKIEMPEEGKNILSFKTITNR